jgi:thymidylate kinase
LKRSIFHQNIRGSFLNEAREFPKRYRIIDAELTEDEILQAILERLPKPNP